MWYIFLDFTVLRWYSLKYNKNRVGFDAFSALKTGSCFRDERIFFCDIEAASRCENQDILSLFVHLRAETKEVFFMQKRKSEEKIFTLVCLALLTAMQIVIARILVIPLSESLRISFSFIPVVIAARRFGITGAVTVYGLGDFIGAVAFPSTGAYFPGFTLTAVISGLIYGVLLGRKTGNVRIILSVILSQLLCTVLMNSFWISSLYGAPFAATALSRLGQAAVMGTVQIIFMITCLERICSRIKVKS